MDRRGFLKFMGVSAAATSASTILANIPEAEPKIELLEPKKLAVGGTIKSEILTIESVIRFRLTVNDNISYSGQGHWPGRRTLSGEIEVYLPSPTLQHIMNFESLPAKARFPRVVEIKDKVFVIAESTISAAVNENVTAVLQVREIMP